MHEVALHEPVCAYFRAQDFVVHAEVHGCDLIAVRGDQTLAIELKLRLNLDVILQATKRQRIVEEVYIAIPTPGKQARTQRWQDLLHLLRRLEIGLLFVRTKPPQQVELALAAKPFDRARSVARAKKERAALLGEFTARKSDANRGGSTRVKLVTAYRERALGAAWLLSRVDSATPAQLRALGAHETVLQILYSNHYGWFDHPSKGRYALSGEGRRALGQYAHLLPELIESFKAD